MDIPSGEIRGYGNWLGRSPAVTEGQRLLEEGEDCIDSAAMIGMFGGILTPLVIGIPLLFVAAYLGVRGAIYKRKGSRWNQEHGLPNNHRTPPVIL